MTHAASAGRFGIENVVSDPFSDPVLLQTENARLIALLESHGIDWHLPSESASLAHEPESSQLSTDEKLALFRRLFRGRTDVYPVRWESNAISSRWSAADHFHAMRTYPAYRRQANWRAARSESNSALPFFTHRPAAGSRDTGCVPAPCQRPGSDGSYCRRSQVCL